ncbi:MAG: hypothetical protein AB7U98_12100 [Candidatus Nitrosocosmicus sp.]
MYFIDGKEDQYDSNGNDRTLTDDSKLITTIKNSRCGLTSKKYQKQVKWRRTKVKELLFKGYCQQEIIDKLHVSQSTISRDIAIVQSSAYKGVTKYAQSLLENHINFLNGSEELLKMGWKILDNPKTDNKTKLKAMEFVENLYEKRTRLFNDNPNLIMLKGILEQIVIKEKYFKDNNVSLDYTNPKSFKNSLAEFNKLQENPRERKDFVF